ncbi:MAG: DUF1592 domain-containing protein [Gemmataceae bacterium]|nr:DUF1592 domain-containing protein [Gemmataceae bacterium]
MSITPPCVRYALVAAAVFAAAPARADDRTGPQIYKEMCARCHGANGEGTKKYAHPLTGDKPLAQLAKVIDETMPEDDPDALDADGSKKVAAYIYDAFYSPVAQARNKPARIELARLTVPQYRNSLADLIGTFRRPGKLDEQRGLRGEYFNARGFDRNKRVIDRLDPQVAFDFRTDAPAKEGFDPNLFAIRWEGSVLAPETGTYEFLVRTDHAARLWVNDPKKPLVDAWVKSGKDTDYKASVFLIAGRAYPVRLEFAKAKQGVTDPKLNKPVTQPAMISLLWKPPHGVHEPVPARDLTPARFPEAFVVSTPFPPDDKSLGWVRGTSVSKEWDAAATDAALETAAYVTSRLPELAGVPDNAPDRAAKLKAFARRFAERAFRRPLTDEQAKFFVDRQFESSPDPDVAVKRVVLLTLLSPRFLYLEPTRDKLDGYDVACRLSFALWDSLPDQELLAAAAAGKLGTRDEVVAHARRMLVDPRAKAKLRDFFHAWLRVDHQPDLAKDSKRFPGFDAAVAADLRTSLDLFLDDVAWSGSSDFRQLLTANEVYLNGRLAKVYGADLPADAPFTKVALDPGRRAGVLTHPYLLAAFAYTAESSPIHRGVFLVRGVLGKPLKPPQEAFSPLTADQHPNLTTRERVALQTKPAACATCHAVINPLGYTLESFDAIGRYRETDNGKPVDCTGGYVTRAGQEVTFAGPADLAKFLAASDEVQDAFAEQLFHHLVKQPVRAYGPAAQPDLRRAFSRNDYRIRDLMVEIVTVAALHPRD